MKVHICGEEWTVDFADVENDSILKDADGYCDRSARKIVIANKQDDCTLLDFEEYKKKVMRHEIVHAYMFECGLGECWRHSEWGQEEQTVDWIANTFPKMLATFKEAGCI